MHDGSNCKMFGRWFAPEGYKSFSDAVDKSVFDLPACSVCDRSRLCMKERDETVKIVVKAMYEKGLSRR